MIRRADNVVQKLTQLVTEQRRTIIIEVARAKLNIQAGAKRRCPVRFGRLRNSIDTEDLNGGMSAVVGTNVDYAPPVEFGTRAHLIEPKNAQALRFQVGGKTVFAKRVHHPGTPAQPFLFPAFEEERPQFVGRLASAMDETNRRVAGS